MNNSVNKRQEAMEFVYSKKQKTVENITTEKKRILSEDQNDDYEYTFLYNIAAFLEIKDVVNFACVNREFNDTFAYWLNMQKTFKMCIGHDIAKIGKFDVENDVETFQVEKEMGYRLDSSFDSNIFLFSEHIYLKSAIKGFASADLRISRKNDYKVNLINIRSDGLPSKLSKVISYNEVDEFELVFEDTEDIHYITTRGDKCIQAIDKKSKRNISEVKIATPIYDFCIRDKEYIIITKCAKTNEQTNERYFVVQLTKINKEKNQTFVFTLPTKSTDNLYNYTHNVESHVFGKRYLYIAVSYFHMKIDWLKKGIDIFAFDMKNFTLESTGLKYAVKHIVKLSVDENDNLVTFDNSYGDGLPCVKVYDKYTYCANIFPLVRQSKWSIFQFGENVGIHINRNIAYLFFNDSYFVDHKNISTLDENISTMIRLPLVNKVGFVKNFSDYNDLLFIFQ